MGKVNINAGIIGVGSRAPVLETLNATENATYTPGTGVDGYNEVNVNVEPNTVSLYVTQNGTYTAEEWECDGFYEVNVDVAGTGGLPLINVYSYDIVTVSAEVG